MRLLAKTTFGRRIMIDCEDKGLAVPKRDVNGNLHEAYTTWFRLIDEEYSQFELLEAERASCQSEVARRRAVADAKVLTAMGVDLKSVVWAETKEPVFQPSEIEEALAK
jgi:hypothetical protein